MKDMSFRLNGVAPEPNSEGAYFVLCTLDRNELQDPKLIFSVTENGKTDDVKEAHSHICSVYPWKQ
jgi:hypothetical protein